MILLQRTLIHIPFLNIIGLLMVILIGLFIVGIFFEIFIKILRILLPIVGSFIMIVMLIAGGLWFFRVLIQLTYLI